MGTQVPSGGHGMSAPYIPLGGVRVLELTGGLAGQIAGMLLADQGADVIAFRDRAAGDEIHAVVDRNKNIVAFNKDCPASETDLIKLLSGVDILLLDGENTVQSCAHGKLLGLAQKHTGLIVSRISAFAESDGFGAAEKVDDGHIAAMTGQFTDVHLLRQLFGLDPVYTPLPLASVYAAVHAVTASVLALNERDRSAVGAKIEINRLGSALSAMTSMYQRIEPQAARYDTPRLPIALRSVALPIVRKLAKSGGDARQEKLLTIARQSYPALMSSYVCADGQLIYLFAVDNIKLTKAVIRLLALEDVLSQEGFVVLDPYGAGDRRDNLAESSNLSRKRQGLLKKLIASALAEKESGYWLAAFRKVGVPCAIQQSTEEWVMDPMNLEAGLMVDVRDVFHGPVRQPGVQCWINGADEELTKPEPSKEIQFEHLKRWRPTARDSETVLSRKGRGLSEWLDGVTVLDLSSMVAGPVAGRTLAEYGAKVIKVEPPNPNHGPRMTCWYGMDVNPGKSSVIIDLKKAEGLRVFEDLVRKADVIVSNHSATASGRLGISPERLQALNPKAVICRIGAFNGPKRGEWDDYTGYDPVLQAASGIMTRYGNPGAPDLHAIASCVDALTGYSAVFATALALRRRMKAGQGSVADVSLAAASSLVQLPFCFSYPGRQWVEPSGQLAKGKGAFSGLYACLDGWIYVGEQVTAIQDLPQEFRVASDGTCFERSRLQKIFRTKSFADIRHAFGEKADQVCQVLSVTAAMQGEGSPIAGRMQTTMVAGLGKLIWVRPDYLRSDAGALKPLVPAVKPGSSTMEMLGNLDIPNLDDALKTGAIAVEIHPDFLPL